MGAVYWIWCKANGRFYIGSSSDPASRFRHHRYYLRHGTHTNEHLQRCWNKYGEDQFDFRVIEDDVSDDKLLEVEQWYLENSMCLDHRFGFNVWPTANRTRKSDEMRRRTSRTLKEAYAAGRRSRHNPNFTNAGVEVRLRPVAQRDMEGNVLRTWRSAKDAERECGFCATNIGHVCKGEQGRTQHGGFRWNYIHKEES